MQLFFYKATLGTVSAICLWDYFNLAIYYVIRTCANVKIHNLFVLSFSLGQKSLLYSTESVKKCLQTNPFFRPTMSKLRAVFILAATTTFFMVTILPETTETSCWKTWSRCTRWSSFLTGVVWAGCDPYCKCLGRSGGRCDLKPSTCFLSNKAWSCQCHGRYGPRQSSNCGRVFRG